MEFQPKAVLAYWQNALIESDRLAIDLTDIAPTFSLPLVELQQGLIHPELVSRLFKPVKGEPELKEEKKPAIEVIAIPRWALRHYKNAYQSSEFPKEIVPFLIPCLLYRDGHLTVNPDVLPSVPRERLEPSESGVTLAAIDDADSFLSTHPMPTVDDGWHAYWDYSLAFFQSIFKMSMDSFSLPEYSVQENALLVSDKSITASVHLIPLYDRLIAQKALPSLLQRFMSPRLFPVRPMLTPLEELRISKRHVGQFNGSHPLSDSQRLALHHFLTQGDGDLLAINGPPGTGKTTLIQSVVASLWVEAALEGREPPLIVASAATNLAVTNIIDSFAKAKTASPSDFLEQRWIPDVQSYGLYCASASAKHEELSRFQLLTSESDFISSRLTDRFVSTAEKQFLSLCSEVAKRPLTTVADAVAYALKRCREHTDALRQGLELEERLLALEEIVNQRYGSSAKLDSQIAFSQSELKDLVEKENAVRATLDRWFAHLSSEPFWLTLFSFVPAVKQRRQMRNEAFWVSQPSLPDLAMDQAPSRIATQFINLKKRLGDQRSKSEEMLQDFKTLKENLTQAEEGSLKWKSEQHVSGPVASWLDLHLRYPAFLWATHYWEGRWLLECRERLVNKVQPGRPKTVRDWHFYSKLTPCYVSTLYMMPKFWSAKNAPVSPLLDLLILDEASQIPPEIAGANMALARQALIIGDVMQIEPVSKTTAELDRANQRRFGLVPSGEDVEWLNDAALAISSGSAIRVAQRQSAYQPYPDIRGMLLTEHRRCVPEIIAYCNELAYQGRLRPLRARLDPAERIFPAMAFYEVNGKAVRVGSSLQNNVEAERIVDWISAQREIIENTYFKLHEALGIVTPFARQAQLIRAELRKKGIERMTVGTVHTFQGAERPIIVFSPVYDGSVPRPYFFDRSKNMLNVAVSRAKDSFLVFGSSGVFDLTAQSPSGLLAKYIL